MFRIQNKENNLILKVSCMGVL